MVGVVVGVDDSSEAAAALRWAVSYAEAANLPLTVVTVLDPLTFTALWTDRPADSVPDTHVEAARRSVGHLICRFEADRGRDIAVPVEIRVEVGHAVKKLVDAADDADLLVVGSHGAGGVSWLLLGSVSAGVSRHARCSVVIVRSPTPRPSGPHPVGPD